MTASTRWVQSPLTEIEPVLIMRGDGRRGPGTQQLEVLHRPLVGVLPRAVAVRRLRGALAEVGRTAVALAVVAPLALALCRRGGRWARGWRSRVGSVGRLSGFSCRIAGHLEVGQIHTNHITFHSIEHT